MRGKGEGGREERYLSRAGEGIQARIHIIRVSREGHEKRKSKEIYSFSSCSLERGDNRRKKGTNGQWNPPALSPFLASSSPCSTSPIQSPDPRRFCKQSP